MTFGEQRSKRWTVLCLSVLFCFDVFVNAQIKYSIPEERNERYVVANVAKDLGLDVSILENRGFRIVSGSKDALFDVNRNTGVLYVSKRIDREEICDGSTICLVNLKIAIDDPLEVHYIVIEITDINDNSPNFPEKEKILEIAENRLTGARFQLQAARDPDIGVNSVRSYKISQNEHFDLQVRERGEEQIPYLVLQKQLDREKKKKHNVILTATDGATPPKSATLNVTVIVLDSNDNPPVFSQEIYSVAIPENIQPGVLILKVSSTDLDEGTNGNITYSFGSEVSAEVRDKFTLDSKTGEIQTKGFLDFEDNDIYKLDVQATDKGQPPLTSESGVIINILDVNDNIPEIEITSLTNVISEDAQPGTVISLISVTDKDSGVNGNVVCHLNETVPFELKSSVQYNMYSLVTKSHLDRELVSQYQITITAADLGQPSLSSVKSFVIKVSDVNDNGPEFLINPLEFYLFENNLPGASIFSVSALDKDMDENSAVSYHIIRGIESQNIITSFLSTNSETGVIHALKGFDFETTKTFQFHVLATDSGTPPLSSNVTVNVYILDQNDNVPAILYPISANGSAESVEEIPRNVNRGHLVTKVRAYDADIGYNGWLLFSLQEVSDHTLFGLDRYTGQIRTLRSFTETDEAEHKLVILVKDNGNVSLSATATMIIKLVEPKEAFAASDVKKAVFNEEENSITIYLIIALGSVCFLFIISITVLIVMQCSKSTDYSSKYLRDTNYDGTLCHSIQYRSGDKRYMLVRPRLSIGSALVPGSNGNTLVIPDRRRRTSVEVGNRYSTSFLNTAHFYCLINTWECLIYRSQEKNL